MSVCGCSTATDDTTTTPSAGDASTRIYVDEIGVPFPLTFVDGNEDAVDLTAATALYLLLEQPDGTLSMIDLLALVDSDAATGAITYTSVAGDLPVAGRYRYQGLAVVDVGSPAIETEYRTDPMVGFNVYPNLT